MCSEVSSYQIRSRQLNAIKSFKSDLLSISSCQQMQCARMRWKWLDGVRSAVAVPSDSTDELKH